MRRDAGQVVNAFFVAGFVCLIVGWNVWVADDKRKLPEGSPWWMTYLKPPYAKWWLLAGLALVVVGAW